MTEITTTVTSITKMVRVHMEVVLLNAIFSQPTLNSLRHLVE